MSGEFDPYYAVIAGNGRPLQTCDTLHEVRLAVKEWERKGYHCKPYLIDSDGYKQEITR